MIAGRERHKEREEQKRERHREKHTERHSQVGMAVSGYSIRTLGLMYHKL